MAIPAQPVGREMRKGRLIPYFAADFLRFMKFLPDPGVVLMNILPPPVDLNLYV